MRRKWSVIFGTVLLTLPVFGCAQYPMRAEVGFQQTVEFAGITAVEVESRNGSIDAVCEPGRKQMEITATKYANGVTIEDARAYAEQVAIEIGRKDGSSGALRIVARFPGPDAGRSAGVSFRIVLPPSAALDLRTSNGRIEASGAEGGVVAGTSNGPVTVTGAKGTISVQTSNGRVTLREVAGDVEVDTSNGGIEMERVAGARITAHTTNGRIRAIETSGVRRSWEIDERSAARSFSVSLITRACFGRPWKEGMRTGTAPGNRLAASDQSGVRASIVNNVDGPAHARYRLAYGTARALGHAGPSSVTEAVARIEKQRNRLAGLLDEPERQVAKASD